MNSFRPIMMGRDRRARLDEHLPHSIGLLVTTLLVATAVVTAGLAPAANAGVVHRRVIRFNGPVPGAFDDPKAATVSPDGSRVYVTGYTTGPDGLDFARVSYDATLQHQLWDALFDGPGES